MLCFKMEHVLFKIVRVYECYVKMHLHGKVRDSLALGKCKYYDN